MTWLLLEPPAVFPRHVRRGLRGRSVQRNHHRRGRGSTARPGSVPTIRPDSAIIQDAMERSTLFQRLIETINATDGLVYVDEGKCGHRRIGVPGVVGARRPDPIASSGFSWNPANTKETATSWPRLPTNCGMRSKY